MLCEYLIIIIIMLLPVPVWCLGLETKKTSPRPIILGNVQVYPFRLCFYCPLLTHRNGNVLLSAVVQKSCS